MAGDLILYTVVAIVGAIAVYYCFVAGICLVVTFLSHLSLKVLFLRNEAEASPGVVTTTTCAAVSQRLESIACAPRATTVVIVAPCQRHCQILGVNFSNIVDS